MTAPTTLLDLCDGLTAAEVDDVRLVVTAIRAGLLSGDELQALLEAHGPNAVTDTARTRLAQRVSS